MSTLRTVQRWTIIGTFLAVCSACGGPGGAGTAGEIARPTRAPSAAHSEPESHAEPAASKSTPPEVAEQEEAPTVAPGRFIQLTDADPGSVLWIPAANPSRAELLVVTHGAGGSPEWHCDYWARVVKNAAFVLCVRGRAMGRYQGAYYYPNHHELEKLLRSALGAFDAEFGAQVGERQVFVGYSQGATMGAVLLGSAKGADLTSRFQRLLLLEGGTQYWNYAAAKRVQRAGGQRVFFACGTASCNTSAAQVTGWLKRAGVEAELSYAKGTGHTPDGAVGRAASTGLKWLLEPTPPAD